MSANFLPESATGSHKYRPGRSSAWWRRREPEQYLGYLFIAPALLFLIIFRFYPMLNGLGYAFTNWNGISPPEFVGLANFEKLIFEDQLFHASMLNTAKLLATLPLWVIFPMTLAILIHQGVPGWQFFRAAYFFPVVLSAVIIGAIFNMVLHINGPLNSLLQFVQLKPVDWLGNSTTALPALILIQIWSSFGMGVVVFLAGLATVPQDLFDAAKVDGANWLQTTWYVTIPSIRRVIEFVAVSASIGMLTSMFGLIYVMTAGGPGTATYLPEFMIWMQFGRLNRPGYATAISTILFILLFFVALIQIRLMAQKEEG